MNLQALNYIQSKYFEHELDRILHLSKDIDSLAESYHHLYQWYKGFVNTLVDQRYKQVFVGYFSKVVFLCQAYGLHQEQTRQLQFVRQVLSRQSKTAGYSRNQVIFRQILVICIRSLQLFSENPLMDSLLKYSEDTHLDKLDKMLKPEGDLVSFSAIIEAVEELKPSPSETQLRMQLLSEEYGKVELILKDHYIRSDQKVVFQNLLAREAKWIREGTEVSIVDVLPISDHVFESATRSVLISYPNYLIDATTVASCVVKENVQSPYLPLLDRYSFFFGNKATLKGNLVNEMLDQLLSNPDFPFEDAYTIALRRYFINTLSLTKEELMQLKESCQQHVQNIRKALENYKGFQMISEPTFISDKYGLQGRLDILAIPPSNFNTPHKRDIVELKSSRPAHASFIAYPKDKTQIACYNLLLESTFPERIGSSEILYSADPDSPLRNCGPLEDFKHNVLHLRNKLLAIDLELAKGNFKVFEQIKSLRKLDVPEFLQQKIDDFLQVYIHSKEDEKAYFHEFSAFVTRELLVAKVGGSQGIDLKDGFSALWNASYADKKGMYQLIDRLTLHPDSSKTSHLHFLRNNTSVDDEITALREGDLIVLYPGSCETDARKALRQQILKGSIEKIDANNIHIHLFNAFIDPAIFEKEQEWSVEPNFLEKGFNHLYASLFSFLKASTKKKELLLGKIRPTFSKTDLQVPLPKHLNSTQGEILKKAIQCKDYMLVQGPPGTGKTSQMLKNLVKYLHDYSEERIVLLAFTNRATDEMAAKVREVAPTSYLRFGNVSVDHPDYDASMSAFYGQEDALKAKLSSSRIFISTVASYYNNTPFVGNVDIMIVDEASQLLEPHLCGILCTAKRFILIGDEKQLPAVVTQSSLVRESASQCLKELKINDLGMSMFERLLRNAQDKKWDDAYAMLDTQYRTHEDIASFINTFFYKKLKIGSPKQQEPWNGYPAMIEDPLKKALANGRLLHFPVPAERTYKVSEKEAMLAAKISILIADSLGKDFNENSIGIICAYRAQIARISKFLPIAYRSKISVDTVERFQGSEREVIVLSLAVTHEEEMKNIQSLDIDETVDKKLNVALSRAKEQLLILGPTEILSTAKYYAELLAFSQLKKIPTSEFR